MKLPLPSMEPLKRLFGGSGKEEDDGPSLCRHCGKQLDRRKSKGTDICHRCLRDVQLFLRRIWIKSNRVTAVMDDNRKVIMVRKELERAMEFQPNPYHNLLENEFFAKNERGKLEKVTLADVQYFMDFHPPYSVLGFANSKDVLSAMRVLGRAEVPVKNIEVRAIMLPDSCTEKATKALKENKVKTVVRSLDPR